MKTVGKVFIWASLALLAVWIIPWICGIIVAKPVSSPFTLYSCVIHDFTEMDRSVESELRFVDRKGNAYGEEIHPAFYQSLLFSQGNLPDSVEGRPVTRDELKLHNYNLTERPALVNRLPAKACLLMESVPLHLELQDPAFGMVFRKDGLHIFRLEDNAPDAALSAAFTQALSAEGFSFPVALTAGNPTHRKEFDEGYLLTDAEGRLFQLKMVDGAPEVRHFAAADGMSLRYISIIEVSDHAILGYLVDTADRLHFLRPDGSVVDTGVDWNPLKEQLFVLGDMFYHTVKVSDARGTRFYALRSDDYSLVDTMVRDNPAPPVNFSRYFLPCRLSFISSSDGFVRPRFRDFSWIGLLVCLFAGAVLWGFFRRRNAR